MPGTGPGMALVRGFRYWDMRRSVRIYEDDPLFPFLLV